MRDQEPKSPVEVKEAAVVPEAEPQIEAGEVLESEPSNKEDKAKKEAQKKREVEEIKKEIPETPAAVALPSAQEVRAYVEKYIPATMRSVSALTSLHTMISRGMGEWWKRKPEGFAVEGKENIPQDGPMLVIANHYRFADETRIRAAMDRPTYVVAADIHFGGSPIKRWFLEKLGFLEVKSSLTNLSTEEKAQLLENVPPHERGYYEQVVKRDEKPGMADQRKFIRQAVALLAKGEPVTVFPEGLWLFEEDHKPEKKMRQAYSGIELIAREYKKVTGKELPILPVVITDGGVDIQPPMELGDGGTVHDVMKVIAAELPEEERGFYKE